jgi:two-component system chemotaxis response regulator CheB
LTELVNPQAIRRDLVVVGASAGGVGTLRTMFSTLPKDFPAAIAVVIHRSPTFASDLPRILGLQTPHTIIEPENDEDLTTGKIYVAPRDRHMTIVDGRFRLSRGPKQHFTRPAIDPLFQSAAESYGDRVTGVVLSGGGDDGVDGLIAIKAAGGVSIAQDPAEADHPPMPENAILFDDVDLVLPVRAIPATLLKLANGEPVRTFDQTARGSRPIRRLARR